MRTSYPKVKYRCAGCRAMLSSDRRLMGQKDTCPACQSENVVPSGAKLPLVPMVICGALLVIVIGVVLCVAIFKDGLGLASFSATDNPPTVEEMKLLLAKEGYQCERTEQFNYNMDFGGYSRSFGKQLRHIYVSPKTQAEVVLVETVFGTSFFEGRFEYKLTARRNATHAEPMISLAKRIDPKLAESLKEALKRKADPKEPVVSSVGYFEICIETHTIEIVKRDHLVGGQAGKRGGSV